MPKVIIIAEAGVNHNGSLANAKKLIDIAAKAGADYVKFQTFKAENLVTKEAVKANYQITNTGENSSQFEMLKSLEFPYEWHEELKVYASEKGINFLSTGFDMGSIDFLNHLGMDFFKVPSGEITNLPYLERIASYNKPIILSTGMADLQEIREAVAVLENQGVRRESLTILHCNTEYPTPMEDVNLLAMRTIKDELGVFVGYSDHTLGIEVPIAAVALGARVIEKHFTINRGMPGPDHAASLEPEELEAMVIAIRNIEKAISGNGVKEPSNSEKINKVVARKSIHAKIKMCAGHKVKAADLIMKRPGDGISPMNINQIVDKILKHEVEANHKLQLSDLL
jgi:N,N'-diacetyllegionaminate synthase